MTSSLAPDAVAEATRDRGAEATEEARVARRVKEAARRFRRRSKAVRLPLRDRLRYWVYYFALAHKGEMIASPTHDAVYADGRLKRGYDRLCERINQRLARSRPVGSGDGASDFIDVPTFAHGELGRADVRYLMDQNIPFLIRGGARDLPVRDWTLEYFEAVAGDCDVPINEAQDRPEEDTSRASKSYRYYQFRTGKLAEVVASIRRGGKLRITTAEDVMHYADGRLRKDLDLPYWERFSGWEENRRHWLRSRMMAGKVVGAQLLMQPQGAFTLWHAEPGDNFFVLAKGTKTWTLAHPYYTAAMRPRVKTTTNYHGSNIDVREPDEVQAQRGFAGYLRVPKTRLTLEPGDVLRVPNYWWHTAVTHPGEYTLAATIRSGGMPNLVAPGYMVLRWFDKQYHAMAVAFAKQGRIADEHIGYPRKSRLANGDQG